MILVIFDQIEYEVIKQKYFNVPVIVKSSILGCNRLIYYDVN